MLNENDLKRLAHILQLKNPATVDAELISFINKYNRDKMLAEKSEKNK